MRWTPSPLKTRRPELDTRYLHNDLISTAFEIFEKTSRFEDAIDLFLKIVGIRLQLDRITILSINTVKLDRSFLTRCTTNQRGLYFLQEIVNMVKGLGYQVICEGIETKDQVDLMRSLGCDAAQGFWFSKAISTEAFEQKYMTD